MGRVITGDNLTKDQTGHQVKIYQEFLEKAEDYEAFDYIILQKLHQKPKNCPHDLIY